jgi:hypothetical protein
MRVSPAFNAIAGPRLYHTLTLGEASGLANPFGGTKRGVFDIPVKKAWMKKSKDKQKTQGKEKDLGLVRHIFFQGYFEPEQFPRYFKLVDRGRCLHSVKSIRFASLPDWLDAKSKSDYITEVSKRFTGLEKLVLTGSTNLPQRYGGFTPTCNKAVILVGRQLGMYPPHLNPSSILSRVDVFVYVCIDKGLSMAMGPHMSGVILDLAIHGSRKGLRPKTFIIVNSLLLQPDGRPQETFQDCITRQVERKKREMEPNTTSPASWQYPTFKFISMREYLRDYDWAGEFTDEEVRPWLEEEDAIKAAAQLEEHIIEGDKVE